MILKMIDKSLIVKMNDYEIDGYYIMKKTAVAAFYP